MMRYRLGLTIHAGFARPTGGGRHLLRVTPADRPGVQKVLSCAVQVDPAPRDLRRFTDFFGMTVTEVVLPPGPTALRFAMQAEVVRPFPVPQSDRSVAPASLAGDLARVTDLGPQSPWHFTGPSQRVPVLAPVTAFARDAVQGAPSLRAAVERLGLAIHKAMTFDPDATHVDTPVADAFAARRGVCQDYAQIMLAGLRGLGVPAAYVSGFLRTVPPPGRPRLVGADAMHAWVRVWTGRDSGWMDYDPTNACTVGADHVEVGAGRDYADCAPVTGVLRLDGTQSAGHSVDMEPV